MTGLQPGWVCGVAAGCGGIPGGVRTSKLQGGGGPRPGPAPAPRGQEPRSSQPRSDEQPGNLSAELELPDAVGPQRRHHAVPPPQALC